MATKTIPKTSDRKTKPPPKYTITKDEYDIIQRTKGRVVELLELTDNNEEYHTVNCLLGPIYDDLSMVLDSTREVKGSDFQDTEHPLLAKVRDVINTGDKLHVDALDKLLDGYGLCPDEYPREGGAD